MNGIYSKVKAILDENGVANGLLRNTADYWARDYMPVQADTNRFIGYVYGPDYLVGQDKFLTNYHQVTSSLKVDKDISEMNVVIDGGNIVVAGDGKVIMTEKIFSENPEIERNNLLQILQSEFQNEVIILPWDRIDRYGHTDGIVRAVDETTVLINLSVFPKRYAQKMRKTLSAHYKVVDLELHSEHPNSWAYINSIQTEKVIIIPGFGDKNDITVLEQYNRLFSSYEDRIYMIEMGDFPEEYGGALNCLTWTVKRNKGFCKEVDYKGQNFHQD